MAAAGIHRQQHARWLINRWQPEVGVARADNPPRYQPARSLPLLHCYKWSAGHELAAAQARHTSPADNGCEAHAHQDRGTWHRIVKRWGQVVDSDVGSESWQINVHGEIGPVIIWALEVDHGSITCCCQTHFNRKSGKPICGRWTLSVNSDIEVTLPGELVTRMRSFNCPPGG